MRRVHRSLELDQINALRDTLNAQLPKCDMTISDVIRQMRLITKRSQSEYAKLCGIAPRALADIESGNGNPRLSTLQALLRPFACDVGVVRLSDAELRRRRPMPSADRK
jgi:transcriptional regulator with XRE-family HTH domain